MHSGAFDETSPGDVLVEPPQHGHLAVLLECVEEDSEEPVNGGVQELDEEEVADPLAKGEVGADLVQSLIGAFAVAHQQELDDDVKKHDDRVDDHRELERLAEVTNRILSDHLLGDVEHHADDVGERAGQDPGDEDQVHDLAVEARAVVEVDEQVQEERGVEEHERVLQDPDVPGVQLGAVRDERRQWEDVVDLVLLSYRDRSVILTGGVGVDELNVGVGAVFHEVVLLLELDLLDGPQRNNLVMLIPRTRARPRGGLAVLAHGPGARRRPGSRLLGRHGRDPHGFIKPEVLLIQIANGWRVEIKSYIMSL